MIIYSISSCTSLQSAWLHPQAQAHTVKAGLPKYTTSISSYLQLADWSITLHKIHRHCMGSVNPPLKTTESVMSDSFATRSPWGDVSYTLCNEVKYSLNTERLPLSCGQKAITNSLMVENKSTHNSSPLWTKLKIGCCC